MPTKTTEWPIGEQARRMRRHKMQAMLEAFDLTPDDFVLWLRDECAIVPEGSSNEPT